MSILKQKVSLEGVRFFAYHGFYPEEQIVGTEFLLDIEAEMEVFSAGEDEIANTINYERLFHIASAEMSIPRKLIETVAHNILDKVRHEFLAAQFIRVKIRKMNPPMGGEIRNSAIELVFKR